MPSIPVDRPVAILMRHAERPAIPRGEVGADVLLTAAGHRQAHRVGVALGHRVLRLASSPVPRCVETAESIGVGAGAEPKIALDTMLGDPGAFVADGERAWPNWLALGHDGVMARLIAGDETLPGLHPPRDAARRLLEHLTRGLTGPPGIWLSITHDAVLWPLVALLGAANAATVPGFLECAALWWDGPDRVLSWRGEQRVVG